MLFRGTVDESVTRTVRRWRRRQARVGGRYRIPGGRSIEVESMEVVGDLKELTAEDARLSGFGSLGELREALGEGEGTLYRIDFRHVGVVADPRAELAADEGVDAEAFAEVSRRLGRLDAGRDGVWTRRVLELIGERPGVVSTELADAVGMERARFKSNVRRLKGLGLTISLERGYELSPRGRVVLGRLRRGG